MNENNLPDDYNTHKTKIEGAFTLKEPRDIDISYCERSNVYVVDVTSDSRIKTPVDSAISRKMWFECAEIVDGDIVTTFYVQLEVLE